MASPITRQRILTAPQIIEEINPRVIGPSYTEANTQAMRREDLLANTQILRREKINQDFVISQGFAKSVSTEDEFFSTFDEFLSQEDPVQLQTPVGKFSEELPRMLGEMKRAVEQDRSLEGKRIYKRDPKVAANIF